MSTTDVDEQQSVPQVIQTPSEKFFRYFQHEVTGLFSPKCVVLIADYPQICKPR